MLTDKVIEYNQSLITGNFYQLSLGVIIFVSLIIIFHPHHTCGMLVMVGNVGDLLGLFFICYTDLGLCFIYNERMFFSYYWYSHENGWRIREY